MRPITAIDKDINATVKALCHRQSVSNTLSAADWQRAWDAEPELAAQHKALYRERGLAQVERDQKEYQALMVTARQRVPKGKVCGACHGTGRAA